MGGAGPATARALLGLARPKGTAALLGVVLLGYGFAHWDRALPLTRPGALGVVLVAWLLLGAGTMWLNAALDGDEGAALFAGPARRPRHLTRWGYAALLSAVGLSALASPGAALACAACAALSVLYSHPRTMWKAHPLLGPAVNGLGYGLLGAVAGWAVPGVAMSVRTAAAFALLSVFVVGMALGAQAFQREDDARRGYRTLVVTHGPAACLRALRGCTLASVAGVGVLCALGVYPRLCLLGLPAFLVADRWTRRWQAEPGGGGPEHASGLVLRMLAGCGALVGLAYAATLLGESP